jgi:flagellar hook-length control protein FliK
VSARPAADPESPAAANSTGPAIAAASSRAAAADQPDRTSSRVSAARPADPGTLPGAITLSPTSAPLAAAPAPTTPVASPAAPPQPLNAQLAPTLFHLRSAEAGTHVLTLTVAPEAVGPVTVRAHVGADGIRIELSAPTAQGRSALDAILPELRRDLSQGGMNSALSLAAAGSDGSAGGRPPFDGASGSFAGDRGAPRSPSVPSASGTRESSTSLSASVPTILRSGATALDVLA